MTETPGREVKIAAGVASIQGIYTGQVSLSRLQQPGSFVLTANAAGGPGTVSTSVQVRLAGTAGGTTELSYDADAVITGLIAGIGQRMLSSVARRMAGEFFSSVDDVMAAAGVVSKAAGPAEPGPAPASTATVPAAPQPSAYFIPAAPPAAALPAAASTASGFVSGVLVGAAAALGGMAVGKLIGRRAR